MIHSEPDALDVLHIHGDDRHIEGDLVEDEIVTDGEYHSLEAFSLK